MANIKSFAVLTAALFHNNRLFRPGQEDELLNNSTPEEREDWLKRGIITGQWDGETDGAAEARAQQDESQRLENVVARLSGAIPFARNNNESPLETLERMADDLEGGLAAAAAAADSESDESAPDVPPSFEEVLREKVGDKTAASLLEAGFDSQDKIDAAQDEELLALPNLGDASLKKLRG